MKWLEEYVSNTMAGSGNQFAFASDGKTVLRSRVYYKVMAGGEYGYSFLYTNVLDSTFAEGDRGNCNMICDEWKIMALKAGVVSKCSAEYAADPAEMKKITFGGCTEKTVAPGEFFTTDEVMLAPKSGEYICIEMEFSGTLIPCHPESILPAFRYENGKWTPSQELAFASMVGCRRGVRAKVGFMGDSITQGIGTPYNAYTHWDAVCADAIGTDWSWWNLGLGYARAYDMSSNGAWLYKGKHMDYAVVCYGTNDVGHNRTADQIVKDLEKIMGKLHAAGTKVLLQTLPPFNWTGENLEKWLEVNRRVRTELAPQAEAFFDVVPVLTDDEESGVAKYGGHPDEEGCAKWADALTPVLRALLEK